MFKIKIDKKPEELQPELQRIKALSDENRALKEQVSRMRPAYMKLMQHQGMPVG